MAETSDGSSTSSGNEACRIDSALSAEEEDDIKAKLSEGESALRKIRCRLTGALGAAGIACFLLCQVTRALYFEWKTSKWDKGHNLNMPLREIAIFLQGLLLGLAHVFLGMAPLMDDRFLTRCMLVTQAVMLPVFAYEDLRFLIWHIEGISSHVCEYFGNAEPYSFCLHEMWMVYSGVKVLSAAIGSIALLIVTAIYPSQPDRMQQHMWMVLAVCFASVLVVQCYAIISFAAAGRFDFECFRLPGLLLSLLMAASPGARERAQVWLRGKIASQGALAAAAGVAGLLGGCSGEEVLAQASSRFRYISLEHLTFEDMADNRPSPSGADLSESHLGYCDAFISHSWSDDATLKWAALQTWRAKFLAEHGREPRVWIDKICINQNDIATDLRCLPVFLKACNRLVVLCGATYFSRLWCILELFTFVHIGGHPNNIDFSPLLRRTTEHEEHLAEFQKRLRHFDVGKCQCSDANDKQKILSIIHVAYGGIHAFTAAVHEILRPKLLF